MQMKNDILKLTCYVVNAYITNKGLKSITSTFTLRNKRKNKVNLNQEGNTDGYRRIK